MGLFLDVYVVYALRVLWRLVNLLRSRRWNKTNATVLGSHLDISQYASVRVDYEYGADSPKRAATFVKPFILESSAKAYADRFARGMAFTIRIKPGDPEASIADTSVENWWNHKPTQR